MMIVIMLLLHIILCYIISWYIIILPCFPLSYLTVISLDYIRLNHTFFLKYFFWPFSGFINSTAWRGWQETGKERGSDTQQRDPGRGVEPGSAAEPRHMSLLWNYILYYIICISNYMTLYYVNISHFVLHTITTYLAIFC